VSVLEMALWNNGNVDLTSFEACFPGQVSDAEMAVLTNEAAENEKSCPSASMGEGRTHLPASLNRLCMQYQAAKLHGQRIVYTLKAPGTNNFVEYVGRLETRGTPLKLCIRLTEAYNYFNDLLPPVQRAVGATFVDFPVPGYQYGSMIAATRYLAVHLGLAQNATNAALQQVQQLSGQLAALQVSGSSGVVAVGGSSTSPAVYLQGCDITLPFDVWNPASYNTTFYRDPQLAVLSTITAIRLGGRQDVIRQELIETAELAMRAWATEKQPFLSPWTEVLRSVLARVRDYDWRCQGIDPQTIRFNLNKEAGFPGLDPLQAAYLQAKQKQSLKAARGAPRGGGGYQAGYPSRGRGQGNGRGAGSQ
jgi:hypothetical protein